MGVRPVDVTCGRCGAPVPPGNKLWCGSRCRQGAYRDRLKTKGLCPRCGDPKGADTKTCQPCAERDRARSAAHYEVMPFVQYAVRRMRDRRAKALIRQKERSR